MKLWIRTSISASFRSLACGAVSALAPEIFYCFKNCFWMISVLRLFMVCIGSGHLLVLQEGHRSWALFCDTACVHWLRTSFSASTRGAMEWFPSQALFYGICIGFGHLSWRQPHSLTASIIRSVEATVRWNRIEDKEKTETTVVVIVRNNLVRRNIARYDARLLLIREWRKHSIGIGFLRTS